MKTKLTVIAILATLVSACTTGTYMTRAYDDDIYFSPGDVPPVAIVEVEAPREKSAQMSNNDTRDKKIVLSQIDRNADGTSSVNNYIYQPDENENPDNQNYNMDDQELVESDTTAYYNDEDVKYVINNYYDENDNDLDFAYRINRFHRPYYYSPFFYDDWMYGGYYSPYYSGYYGMNYGWGYNSWYGGFGYPYSYYGGYYSPFSFGFGGYWGGGYGGYYNGYNNGYYNGYYGGGGGFYNDHQVARRRSTDMNLPGGSNGYNKSANGDRSTNQMGGVNGRANSNTNSTIVNGQSRTRSINATGENQDVKNATIVNDRRTNTGRQVNSQTQQSVTSGNARRTYEPSTTGRTYDQGRVVKQSQNYTPSYNKPRIVNQSNYNSNSYTRPRTAGVYNQPAVKSANSNSQNQTYTQPRSSSNMRQTYRSSSSYSTGSSSSGTRSSSSYNRSSGNSGSTYSAPSRSSSSPSYSGGSSSSGSSSGGSSSGSSSGGSSGGGGGSGSRR